MFEQNAAEQAANIMPTTQAVCLATKEGNQYTVALMWRTWAAICIDTNRYQSTLEYMEKMLEILKETFPENDINLTMGYNGVGVGHIGFGNWEKAEWNLNKSLEIRDLYPNSDQAMRGLTLANLSAMNCLRGDYEKALELAQRGLPYIEKNLGRESIKSAEYV